MQPESVLSERPLHFDARTRTTVCGSPNNRTIRTTCHMGEDQAWRDKRGSWASPEFVAFSSDAADFP
jgi:hypothetical protein